MRHDPVVLTQEQARGALTDLIHAATGSIGVREAGWAKLFALSPGELVRLDDNARTGWQWRRQPWTALRAGPQELAETTGLVAAVASMHPDGRVRQPAAQALRSRPGPLPTALLALRSVDHVPQVREDALTFLESRPLVEDARAALPVLLTVAAREHGPVALSQYASALVDRNGGPGVLLQLLDSPDRPTRRWAFTRCLEGGLLTVDDLLAAAQDRRDQFIRHAAADALEHQQPSDQVALRTLLRGRYADGRIAALAALSDHDLSDPELLAALLDRSTRVRDTARWRAGRRGLDVAAVYRQVLSGSTAAPASPGAAVSALLGLAWTGTRADLPLIENRLADPHPSVRTAAIRALVARTEPGEVAERVAGMLLDESSRVAVAAARVLAVASPTSTLEVEQAAWASEQVWSRRAAWHVGRARGGWHRVEVDLRAAADRNPAMTALGRASVLNWLRSTAATTWNQPHGARADRIAALLTAAQLDVDTTRLVAFHAGLPSPIESAEPRTSDVAALPDKGSGVPAPRRGWWPWSRRRR